MQKESVLSKEEMKNLSGGVSNFEYCQTLHGMLISGGYQGSLAWAYEVWNTHCSEYPMAWSWVEKQNEGQ